MTMRRAVLIAGLAGLAAVTTACGAGGHTSEDSVSYDVPGKVAALRVTTDSGTIEVIGSDREGVHVTERLQWRKNKPATSHDVHGDTLELTFECPTAWGLGAAAVTCEVSYRVEVPTGTRLTLASDDGDVKLTGIAGDVEVTSDSGSIAGDGLSARRVVTKSDSGNVTLAFSGPPDALTTETDSGDTEVRVPGGPYRITARTGSGDKNITTAGDATAQRSIELISDSGDLALAPA